MESDDPEIVAARQLIADVLDLYRHQWETTGNPVWVWTALDFVLPTAAVPLPPWCADYLHTVARRMVGLTAGLDWRRQPIPLIVTRKDRRKLSRQEAMALLPAALGMTGRRGYNAFTAHLAHRSRMNNEARLWELLTTHPTKAAAVRAYMRETGHRDPKRIMIAARKVAGLMAGRGKHTP